MICETKNGKIRLIREDWAEWFRMFKREGCRTPPFYLPVRYVVAQRASECWVFPLAPFVVVWFILREAGWKTWTDLLNLLRDITDDNAKKHD